MIICRLLETELLTGGYAYNGNNMLADWCMIQDKGETIKQEMTYTPV